MQQNTTFQLDRISRDDKFSPDTLNGNAAQVEAALNTMSTMMVAGDAALRTDLGGVEERVTALELKKVVAGTYTGDGRDSGQTIQLGFTPIAVFTQANAGSSTSFAAAGWGGRSLSIVENGFLVTNNDIHMNHIGVIHQYLAFG